MPQFHVCVVEEAIQLLLGIIGQLIPSTADASQDRLNLYYLLMLQHPNKIGPFLACDVP